MIGPDSRSGGVPRPVEPVPGSIEMPGTMLSWHPWRLSDYSDFRICQGFPMKAFCLMALMVLILQGCATAIAVADVTASTVIYTTRTLINVVDAVTPDIVNRDRREETGK